MNAAEALEAKIRKHIPLSGAMGFHIRELAPELIRVDAPLEPNVNIHGTGFAGSIYSVGILTGWALATHLLDGAGSTADLVLARAEIRYRSSVIGPLECCCRTDSRQRDKFLTALERVGKGVLDLVIEVGEAPNAVINARFWALV